ncbi:MAG: hypothetical protein IK020_05320 [Clostridiales bacterium]|nr:hypothetical protein [Clostridiales bacterium]
MDSLEEKPISLIDVIKEELDCNSFVFLTSSKHSNALVMEIVINDYKMRIYFFAYDKKINIRLVFPFASEQGMLPILALFLTEYRDKAFTNLRIDMETGVVFFDYSYLVRPGAFDSEFFWIYVRSMTSEACRLYKTLSRMCAGRIEPDMKEYYRVLLTCALERLQSDDS